MFGHTAGELSVREDAGRGDGTGLMFSGLVHASIDCDRA
jgi:hypothetical protein